MEREGQVQFTKQKKYILQNRDELIKGRIIGTVMATAFCVLKIRAVIYLSVLGK